MMNTECKPPNYGFSSQITLNYKSRQSLLRLKLSVQMSRNNRVELVKDKANLTAPGIAISFTFQNHHTIGPIVDGRHYH